MVKHIVFWKLKKKALSKTAAENALLIKEQLEGLNGKIPSLLSLEVGFDYSKTRESVDIVAYCTFATRKDVDAYLAHPEHDAVVPFLAKVTSELRYADYEV